MRRDVVIIVAASLATWGCSPPTPPARGVDYFKAHPDEARAVQAQCVTNANAGDECAAAAQAVASIKADATFNEAIKTSKRKNEVGRKW